MKSIIIWFAKKYALSAIQDAVDANKDEVGRWSQRIRVWLRYIGKVSVFLDQLAAKLEDGVLTAEEADVAVEEARTLATELKEVR